MAEILQQKILKNYFKNGNNGSRGSPTECKLQVMDYMNLGSQFLNKKLSFCTIIIKTRTACTVFLGAFLRISTPTSQGLYIFLKAPQKVVRVPKCRKYSQFLISFRPKLSYCIDKKLNSKM